MTDQQIQFGSQVIDPYQQNRQPRKMDILFYDAIGKLKYNLSFAGLFHLLKAVLFIVFIPLDYTIVDGDKDSRILGAMILALVASFLQFVGLILYRLIPMKDNKMLVNLSALMGHATQQHLIGQYNNLKQCVSLTMYNQQNLTQNSSQGLTPQLRQKYTTFMASYLRQTVIKCHPCLSKIDSLAQFLGFVSFIYAIIALIVGNYNTAQLVVLIVFIVLEGCSKIIVILVLAVIALFPVLCIVFCCCLCCCIRGEDAEAKLPQAEKATENMITQADGTCSICYQNFVVGDNVVRLKCSPKHMFHPMCISGWTRLKPTCPICRASINNPSQPMSLAQNNNN